MQLPKLLLIADGFTNPFIASKVIAAVKAGVRWVQLRDHGASTDTFDLHAVKLYREIVEIDRTALVTVNSRIRVAEDQKMHFHTGRHGPSLYEARMVLGHDAPVGVSVHDGKELAGAVNHQAQYVIFSPIFATQSHPDVRPVGLEVLKKVCHHSKEMPVIALGGITPENAGSCLDVGAHGVAVTSAILKAPNVVVAIQAFSRAISGL